MRIIKENVDELALLSGFQEKRVDDDPLANILLNRWRFFDECEADIQKITGESAETILYSKYYWCTRYKERFNQIYEKNVGIDQQQYGILEEISRRFSIVNWGIIQEIEEECC